MTHQQEQLEAKMHDIVVRLTGLCPSNRECYCDYDWDKSDNGKDGVTAITALIQEARVDELKLYKKHGLIGSVDEKKYLNMRIKKLSGGSIMEFPPEPGRDIDG